MGNLAATYGALGRHVDALAMGEKALEFYRRVLPANHPDIGEGSLGSDALHDVCFDCEGLGFRAVVELTCRHGHGQPCFDVLCAWKARGCSCDGRKSAGVQSSRAACEPS
jgi:hypothetical protein